MNWSGLIILGLVLAAIVAGTAIALHDGNMRVKRSLAQFDADRSVREAQQAERISRVIFDRPDTGSASARDLLIAAAVGAVLGGCAFLLWLVNL